MRQGVLILAAGRVRSKKKKRKESAPPKTHHEIHSSPATGTTSRRFVTKNIPCLSPRSPASVDPGFVEIDLVQLSQTVKTTSVTHAHRQTDRQTDRQRDRQTGRQADRQTDRQADIQAN